MDASRELGVIRRWELELPSWTEVADSFERLHGLPMSAKNAQRIGLNAERKLRELLSGCEGDL